MTFREWATDHCVRNGMFDDQAEAVVERLVESTSAMSGRWDEDMNRYPPIIMAGLMLPLKRIALEYIDAECPMAWFRPMFQ